VIPCELKPQDDPLVNPDVQSNVWATRLGSTSVSSVVPEPASIVSLALGLVCCAGGCFRRRKAAASAV